MVGMMSYDMYRSMYISNFLYNLEQVVRDSIPGPPDSYLYAGKTGLYEKLE